MKSFEEWLEDEIEEMGLGRPHKHEELLVQAGWIACLNEIEKEKEIEYDTSTEGAGKRNFSKFRMKGLSAQITSLINASGVLTSDEERKLICSLSYIDEAVTNWKEQTPTSKKMYVKEVS